MQRNMVVGFTIVAIALITSAAILLAIPSLYPQQPTSNSAIVRVIEGDTEVQLTLQDLTSMNTRQGVSVLQNRFGNWRDPGTYEGPLLSDVVEVVGVIDENDVIRVNASDGWTVYYAHYNLYPNSTIQDLQGDLILAYSFNGTTLPTWTDGLRTVFLPADERYSNDDANQTTHPAWFFGSAGARWNKNVVSIEILRDSFPPSPGIIDELKS